jgi:hypothetical protein
MAFWNDPTRALPKQQHRWVVSFSEKNFTNSTREKGGNFIPFWYAKSVDRPSYEIKTVQAKHLYSNTFNFPTRVIWKPIKITLYDVSMRKIKGDANNKNNSIDYLLKPYLSDGNTTIIESDGSGGESSFSTQLFFYKFLQEAGYYNPEELSQPERLVRYRSYTFKNDMVAALVGKKDSNRDFKINNNKSEPVNTADWYTFDIKELDPEGNTRETWKLYNPIISDVSFDKLDYSAENVLTINATIAYDWAELVINNVVYDNPAQEDDPLPKRLEKIENKADTQIPPRPSTINSLTLENVPAIRAAYNQRLAELEKTSAGDFQTRILKANLQLNDESLLTIARKDSTLSVRSDIPPR